MSLQLRPDFWARPPTRRHEKRTEEQQVDEPFSGACAVILVKFNEVSEPKGLNSADLQKLVNIHGSYEIAAKTIGASEAFVRQNSN
ncbi:MAG: hypothetical protein ACK5P5_04440 [Pseudobdellovibrionaceae bacterium]